MLHEGVSEEEISRRADVDNENDEYHVAARNDIADRLERGEFDASIIRGEIVVFFRHKGWPSWPQELPSAMT